MLRLKRKFMIFATKSENTLMINKFQKSNSGFNFYVLPVKLRILPYPQFIAVGSFPGSVTTRNLTAGRKVRLMFVCCFYSLKVTKMFLNAEFRAAALHDATDLYFRGATTVVSVRFDHSGWSEGHGKLLNGCFGSMPLA